jgi:hypothetical protein
MSHPVFRLVTEQPMLLANHVGAYADMALEELGTTGAALKRQMGWQLMGVLCLVVAAVLGGVAVLLWAALPEAASGAAWVFIATPVLPALLGLGVLWGTQGQQRPTPFARLRVQLLEDVSLLNRHRSP